MLKNVFPTLLLLSLSVSIMLVSAAPNDGQEPGLLYSTFVGTSLWDEAEAITVDDNGRIYVVGESQSTTIFPEKDQSGMAHEIDMFVFRLNPAGTAMDYVYYLNTSPDQQELEDMAFDVAVDSTGSAYVVGQTEKINFCDFLGNPPGYDTTHNGSVDAFAIKIKPDGSGLDYCTYLGGSEWDTAYSLQLDENNNVYIAGFTWSPEFPTTEGVYDDSINGLRDVFVAKLSADGTQLEYSTFMGGTGQETANAIALDNQNNAYVTGWTTSDDLPIPTTVLDDNFDGPFDSFVFKLSSDGSNLDFNTYLGGEDEDRGEDIIVDDQGKIYVVGETRSPDFPTTPGSMDTTFGGNTCFSMNCSDAFALRMNPTATSLEYATFIGGDSEDMGRAAFLQQDGSLFVTGDSISATGFPTSPFAYDSTPNGEGDGFALLLNETGSAFNYVTYLGSTDVDKSTDIWSDSQGTFYLTGQTLSTDFPTTSGSFDTQHNGDYDVFVSRLRMPEITKFYIPSIFR
ncbi:MAG: SBBP repeat-containing protein [Candidatus Promineifilaceae bacterium]